MKDLTENSFSNFHFIEFPFLSQNLSGDFTKFPFSWNTLSPTKTKQNLVFYCNYVFQISNFEITDLKLLVLKTLDSKFLFWFPKFCIVVDEQAEKRKWHKWVTEKGWVVIENLILQILKTWNLKLNFVMWARSRFSFYTPNFKEEK